MKPPKRPAKDPDELYNDNLALLKRLEEKEQRIATLEAELKRTKPPTRLEDLEQAMEGLMKIKEALDNK